MNGSKIHPKTGTREEWLDARRKLLTREKELTRLSDELAEQRRELPRVPVEKEYMFETSDGSKSLADLFDGRSQLLVFHLMFGPDAAAACPGCSFMADHVDGALTHLNHRDVTFLAVSRAQLEKLNAYKQRMGWNFPWVSLNGNGFNIDFALFTDEEKQTGTGFNFGTPKRESLRLAPAHPKGEELHGLSAFVLEDDVVYHTYSTYDRGTDILHGTWQFLDRTSKGRGTNFSGWPRRHDEYSRD